MDRHDDICAFRSGTLDEEAMGGELAGGWGFWHYPAVVDGIVTGPGQAVSYFSVGGGRTTVGGRNRVEELDQRLKIGGGNERANR